MMCCKALSTVMALACLALVCPVVVVVGNDELHSSLRHQQALFPFASEPVPIDFGVTVALVGFNGDGNLQFKLDAGLLQSLLYNSLANHRPSLISHEREMSVQFHFNYNVVHVPDHVVQTLERSIIDGIRRIKGEHHGGSFIIPCAPLQSLFDEALSFIPSHGYTVFLLSPSIDVIAAGVGMRNVKDFKYAYHCGSKYSSVATSPDIGSPSGQPSSTQSWITSGRSVALDITAGPVSFGPSRTGLGAITKSSFPRLETFLDAQHRRASTLAAPNGQSNAPPELLSSGLSTELRAQLCKVVMSSIRYVFVPDVLFPIMDSKKILVPLVALRNHVLWDPIDSNDPNGFDESQLQRSLRSLELPDQHIVLLTDLHGLHEHKEISVAVSKAARVDSVHLLGAGGKYHISESPYLDGESIIMRLRDSEELLTRGLIHREGRDASHSPQSDLHEEANDETSGHEATRILPLYLLSLHGRPRDFLMDRAHGLTATSHDVAVCLQTNASYALSSYFAGGDLPLRLYPRRSDAHLLSAAVSGLRAVVPPYQRYNPLHGQVEEDYTWAHGLHPFGPFGGAATLPLVFQDVARRNQVLCILDDAVNTVRRAIGRMQQFAEDYLHDTFGGQVDDASMDELEAMFISAFGGGGGNGDSDVSVSHVVFEQLLADLARLEGDFRRVGDFIKEYRLSDAYLASQAARSASLAFEKHLKRQLEMVEEEMFCCFLKHDIAHGRSGGDVLELASMAMAGGAVLALGAWWWRCSPGLSGDTVLSSAPRGVRPTWWQRRDKKRIA